MPTAIIYTRVSTERQEKEATAESQEREAKVFAAAKQLIVARVAREQHTGAELWERPVLSQVRDAIRNKEIDTLICHSVDRLSRDTAHLMILYDECQRAGVRMEFVIEEFDATPEGKLMLSVKGFVAEMERIKIRERAKRGKQQTVERGRMIVASCPLYGYEQDRETSARALHPVESKIVRRIFDLSLSGLGARAIAELLNSEGIPAPSDGKRTFKKRPRDPRWCKTTILRMLRDPAYTGMSAALRWSREKVDGRARVSILPRDQWRILSGDLTEAIITPEEFDRIQELLRARYCGDAKRNQNKFALLRGLIYCGKCGRRREVDTNGYRCTSRGTGAGRCGSPATPRVRIEKWIWQEVANWLKSEAKIEDWLHQHPAPRPDDDTDGARLLELEILAQRLTDKQKKLLTSFGDTDEETGKLIAAQVKQIGAERQTLKLEIDSLKRKLNAPKVAQENFLAIVKQLRIRFGENPDWFTPERQREYLEALGVFVTVDQWEDRRWNFGLAFGA